jgi:hypothetical protein
MFDVKTTEGVVTGHIAPTAYMDAATVGDTAGFEVALERVHAFDAPRSQRHAPLVLSLDMDPATMRQLALVLAVKSGMPAFNEREWRTIADALVSTAGNGHAELASRILDAYSA